MMNYRDFKSENIAYSPEIWRKLFSIIPARNFGIELDPAHMVWQQIDYIKAIYEFSDRIFHIHAKDMEIRREVLGDCGIYGLLFEDVKGLGHGWWRARTPGFGEVKWTALITALLEVGYRGNIDIEHEDDVLAAAAKLGAVKEESDIVNSYCEEPNGLILGYETLSRLMPRDDN
jgi:sugar phosphate isomerase/epimerase